MEASACACERIWWAILLILFSASPPEQFPSRICESTPNSAWKGFLAISMDYLRTTITYFWGFGRRLDQTMACCKFGRVMFVFWGHQNCTYGAWLGPSATNHCCCTLWPLLYDSRWPVDEKFRGFCPECDAFVEVYHGKSQEQVRINKEKNTYGKIVSDDLKEKNTQ